MRSPKPLVLALTLSAAACATAVPDPAALRKAALPLRAPWPATLPPEVAARFDAEVANRRFVLLGEGDHYVADKFPYRLAFLRELVLRGGLRHVALEMGPSDAGRIDAYLATGDERWLERVVLLGYLGESPRERRDLAFYARLPEAQRRAAQRFGEAEKDFFRALRALSEEARPAGGRVHLFGFDLDSTPAGGYEDGRRLLETCAADPMALDTLAALTQPAGISGFDEVRRLEALAIRLAELAPALETACGPAVPGDLRETVEVLADSLRYFLERSAASADSSPSGLRVLRDVYDRRERRMDVRFSVFVAGLPAQARVALFLHNLHASRASETFHFGLAPHSAAMWKNIGSYIESRFPGQTYVIWLLYARGTRLDARAADGTAEVSPRAGSLEAHLDQIPGPYLVFLGDVPVGSVFDLPAEFGTDTSYGAGVLRGTIDALVNLPEAHAP